ncbi:zinc finger protein 597 isoform X3 [Cricetulus griseus]|uniref:Zinc finger protein 597 isoform X3 n=1 Tax=Cricetulus griseus TaxID=10029 RepID=A0A9J7K0W2_CRIGR|nr:zinc finger protein 597 isoform X3 [Cricetulus griseus]XP_035304139.1 zinc finger protein 597 isoform X3 [Cricetulus griseus]XP_035304140.1 zinc finger protein 597 isoform X3 [Cricetulus griseus]
MPPFHFQFLQSLAEGPRKGQFPTPLRAPRRCRRHGNDWALRSAAAQRSVEGRALREPGLSRPASALGVAAATSPPPRLAPAEAPAASPRTGAGGSGRRRGAQRILGKPGRRTWNCGSPRDGLCNRQGPQPGRRRRPAALPPLVRCRRLSPEDHWPLHHVVPPSLTLTPPSWERAPPAVPGLCDPKAARAGCGCGSARQLLAAEPLSLA